MLPRPFLGSGVGRRGLARLSLTIVLGSVAACGPSDDEAQDAPRSLSERVFELEIGSDRTRQVEDLVRDCMTAEGWRYIPFVPAAPSFSDFDQDEFIDKWGFGVTTFIGHQFETQSFEPTPDPNQEYLNKLDAAATSAYQHDLYGGDVFDSGPTDLNDALEDDVVSREPDGCQPKAYKAVYGDSPLSDPNFFDSLFEIDTQVAQDERVVKANEKWVVCMADRGLRFADLEAIQTHLQDRLDRLREAAGVPGSSSFGKGFSVDAGPFPVDGGSSATTPPSRTLQDVLKSGDDNDSGDPDSKLDPVKLRKLQDEERLIAATDRTCRQKHITPVEEGVRRELEDQFLGDHPELAQELG